MELTFEARGEQTEITLRHTGVPDDEMGHQHKDGWTWILSRLLKDSLDDEFYIRLGGVGRCY